MSATTSTTKDASLKMRKHVYGRNGAKKLPDRGRTQRSSVLNMTGVVLTLAPPLVLAVVLLSIWYAGTASGRISSLILPTPGDVLASLSAGLSSGLFVSNALITIQESILGFLIALGVALPLGYGIAKSRVVAATLQPYLSAGQAIPAIVLAPLLILWLGYGIASTVVICMLLVLFPMIINTVLGIHTIDSALTDAARVEGASGWSMLAHIEFPLALPAILAAIRTSFTLSITGAIVGEFVSNGDKGLGSLVFQSLNQYNTPLLFATLVVLAVLASVYYSGTWLLVRLAEAIY